MEASPLSNKVDVPEFIIKSTMGCSIVVILILTPFLLINAFDNHYTLSLGIAAILASCITNAWYCFRGQYHLALNSYLVSPIAAITVIFAIYFLGDVASYWAFPTTLSFYFVLPERRGTFFNIMTTILVIIIMWFNTEPDVAIRFTAAIIGTSLFVLLSMRQIYRLHSLLKEQAMKDHLTGLLNSSTLVPALEQAIAIHNRTHVPMTIIFLDIDHFKKINDNYGHASGDKVLEELSQLLKERMRETDKIFRTGGEEFLLLAYNTTLAEGMLIAEALRQRSERTLSIDNQSITLSFGVVELEAGMNNITWMKEADDKLYEAKHLGRNQVVG